MINQNPKAIFELIPIDTLKAELNNVEPSLKKEFCEFPVDMKFINLVNLFKVSKIQTRLTINSLKISINIPTFYKNDFVLNTGIPIPFNYKKSVYIVIPSSPYYLTYEDKRTNNTFAIAMSIEEKNGCISMFGKLLCFPKVNYEIINGSEAKLPEYLFIPTYENCNKRKLRLLKNLSSIPNGCNINRVQLANKIIQLEEDKFYLHLVAPSIQKFDCNKNHSKHNISQSILLEKIPKTCSIQFDNGFHAEQSDIYVKIIFHSIKSEAHSISKHDLMKKTFIKNNSQYTIRNLQPEFAELHEQVNNIKIMPRASNENIHITTILSLVTISSMILTCVYITILYRKLKLSQREFPSKSPSSMSTLPPELKCQFNFELPPILPPKTRSKTSIPCSPCYDYPRSSNEELRTTIEKFGSPSVVSVSSNSIVKYATIQKIKHKDPITQV